MAGNRLELYEEILLLALKDREGTVAFGSYYQYALGGALLAGLLLERKVEFEGKNNLVALVDPTPTGDRLLDECLKKIKSSRRRAKARDWVSRFSSLKNLKHRVALGLCRKGILRTEEKQVLLIFSRKVYPELDHALEREIVERLRRVIFSDTAPDQPRTVALLALAQAADLLKGVFDRKELKARKKWIRELAEGDPAGRATKEAIEAAQAAVAAIAAASAAAG